MTDTTAFERLVAGEMVRRAGPVRPVDDLAVFDSIIAATESPKWRFWSTSMPAANGHAPIVTGRTHTMFSPVKAISVGALVFALGGLLLVAQPLDQQRGSVPAAQITDLPAVSVTTTQDCVDIFAHPIVCTWTASDPRLTGTLTHEFVADISAPEPDDSVGLGWSDATLEGPEGSWTGYLYAVWGADPASQLFAVLSGSGAYEGWQYVASTIDAGEELGDSEWFGVTYEGELPPFGPPAATTAE